VKECGWEPPHLFDLGRSGAVASTGRAVGATVRVNISIMSTHARSLWPPSNPEGRRRCGVADAAVWLSQATTSATNHERAFEIWMTYRISVLSFSSTFEGR